MNTKTTLAIVLVLIVGTMLVFANDRLTFEHVEKLENAKFVAFTPQSYHDAVGLISNDNHITYYSVDHDGYKHE